MSKTVGRKSRLLFPYQLLHRWNGNILWRLHKRSRSDSDFHLQNISPLWAGTSSWSVYPDSPWVCGSDTRYLSTHLLGSGEANPGVWPAGAVTVPSTRHYLDEAHTAPGDSYGKRHEGAAIWRTPWSSESFFSRPTPSSWRPHLRLQYFPRVDSGGIRFNQVLQN